jgi:hypothetical protein
MFEICENEGTAKVECYCSDCSAERDKKEAVVAHDKVIMKKNIEFKCSSLEEAIDELENQLMQKQTELKSLKKFLAEQ